MLVVYSVLVVQSPVALLTLVTAYSQQITFDDSWLSLGKKFDRLPSCCSLAAGWRLQCQLV